MNRSLHAGQRAPISIPNLLLIYILTQPLWDAATSACIKLSITPTIGTTARSIFLVFTFFYLLRNIIQKDCPYRTPLLICFCSTTGYLIVFAFYTLFSGGFGYCVQNMLETSKFFYFQYVLLLMFLLHKQYDRLIPPWTIPLLCVEYALVVFVAFLTGTSIISYNAGFGVCGWFYSANDVSNIILLSAPVAIAFFLNVPEKESRKKWYCYAGICISLFSILFCACFIGTKLIFLGIFLYLLIVLCWLLIRFFFMKKERLKRVGIVLLLLAILCCLYPISPLNDYLNKIYIPSTGNDQQKYEDSLQIPGIIDADRTKKNQEYVDNAKGTWLGSLIDENPVVGKINQISSRRLLVTAPVLQQYLESPLSAKLLGIGYVQLDSYTHPVGHLVEMELFAALLRHGILGMVIFFLPFFAVLFRILLRFFRSFTMHISDLSYCSLVYSTAMMLMLSLLTGHILQTPPVSILASILISEAYHYPKTS